VAPAYSVAGRPAGLVGSPETTKPARGGHSPEPVVYVRGESRRSSSCLRPHPPPCPRRGIFHSPLS
jgi:hypothetical protein